jgi:LmbE family N-acetylglucosaminyl deacetylase
MHIEHLDQLRDTYDHIYLSPHLDDAALSCGGAIARHTSAGAKVLVVTLCTAIPPSEGPFSPFAEAMHQRWALQPEEVVTARLHEETLALERLNADSYWAGMLDAIYRRPDAYNSDATLFGIPAVDDPLADAVSELIAQLRGRVPQATFYAPLGVGSHVDHLITFAAALRDHGEMTTAFYEDIPYVTKPGALDMRLSQLSGHFVPSTIDIDATLTRKLGSIACYASQLYELFGGEEHMRQQITEYAEGLRPDNGTYGERLWLYAKGAA